MGSEERTTAQSGLTHRSLRPCVHSTHSMLIFTPFLGGGSLGTPQQPSSRGGVYNGTGDKGMRWIA